MRPFAQQRRTSRRISAAVAATSVAVIGLGAIVTASQTDESVQSQEVAPASENTTTDSSTTDSSTDTGTDSSTGSTTESSTGSSSDTSTDESATDSGTDTSSQWDTPSDEDSSAVTPGSGGSVSGKSSGS
ncbi:hypothetical protein [Glutamicibacter sp. AOP5-A2-18]|uniref:hypothetical protein n=1 Tax=Glutamicibacter sp. AOP5-A2-18 TaxID=3457656 RepID=UPI0040347D80